MIQSTQQSSPRCAAPDIIPPKSAHDISWHIEQWLKERIVEHWESTAAGRHIVAELARDCQHFSVDVTGQTTYPHRDEFNFYGGDGIHDWDITLVVWCQSVERDGNRIVANYSAGPA